MDRSRLDAPEWLRDLRGWLAYVICTYTPLDRLSWRAFLWLLPYAGDWAFRDEDRALRAEADADPQAEGKLARDQALQERG